MAEEAGKSAFSAPRVGLTALTVLFGMQILRAFFPLLVFILRDRFGWHSAALGLLCSAVFATGFLAAAMRRALGPRRFLLLAAGGVGLLRLELQLWQGDPLVDFFLALAGLVLFFAALPALVAAGGRSAPSFALGWFIGLAADTALHGAYGTWDMSWRADPATAAVILALVLIQWWLLARVSAPQKVEPSARLSGPAPPGYEPVATRNRLLARGEEPGRDVPPRLAWAWAAIGPLLFLELLVLGNVARLVALSGWSAEWAALWALLGQLLAVGAAVTAIRVRLPWPWVAVLSAMLVASLWTHWPAGTSAAWSLLAAQVIAAALWTLVVVAIGRGAGSGGLSRLSRGHGMGLLSLEALFFLYYGGKDIHLPLAEEILPPVAAVLLGLAATTAARSRSALPAAGRIGRGWLAAAALVLLPLAKLLTAPEIRGGDAEGFPVRIMTYNLHLGIDPRGHLGLEAIAAAIEAQQPDVVALQEVSRGWLVGGSVDMLSWLSRRLDMPGVFAGTADPLWGNAVLSRRPILDHRALELPTEELLIRRGLLAARIDLGADGELEVIDTHFHHLKDGGEIREMQSQTLLGFWQGRPRTAIVGDFNARPGEPPIELMRRAGLGDVLDLAGISPGYTSSATRPVKRIDYIWITPDLAASDVAVGADIVSDHLPVVATLALRRTARNAAGDIDSPRDPHHALD